MVSCWVTFVFITKQNALWILYFIFINSLEQKHWQSWKDILQFLKASCTEILNSLTSKWYFTLCLWSHCAWLCMDCSTFGEVVDLITLCKSFLIFVCYRDSLYWEKTKAVCASFCICTFRIWQDSCTFLYSKSMQCTCRNYASACASGNMAHSCLLCFPQDLSKYRVRGEKKDTQQREHVSHGLKEEVNHWHPTK